MWLNGMLSISNTSVILFVPQALSHRPVHFMYSSKDAGKDCVRKRRYEGLCTAALEPTRTAVAISNIGPDHLVTTPCLEFFNIARIRFPFSFPWNSYEWESFSDRLEDQLHSSNIFALGNQQIQNSAVALVGLRILLTLHVSRLLLLSSDIVWL